MSSAEFVAPPDYVAAPATEGGRFGLYSTATMRTDSPRWEAGGVQWEPYGCDPGGALSLMCETDGDPYESVEPGVPLVDARPFAVYGHYSCSAGSRPADEATARAVAHLEVTEERQVEWAIATGAVGNRPSFQDATVLTSGPVPLVDAVGLVEQAIGTMSGSAGVVHVPRRLGTILSRDRIAHREGARLETLLGNYVAAGAGYDFADVGPDGDPAADGTAWVYGTGRPLVWRGDVATYPGDGQVPTRDRNDVLVVAVRPVLVAWECVTVAAQVEVDGTVDA